MSIADGSWWTLAVAVAGGLILLWSGLLVALWVARPDELGLQDAVRLLPDVVRLVRRLAADTSLPRGVRIRLGLLLAYLALPFDLVPDFIPVIGYADDAVVVAVALRSVVRHAGVAALERHWPGTPAGLAAVCRLAGLRDPWKDQVGPQTQSASRAWKSAGRSIDGR